MTKDELIKDVKSRMDKSIINLEHDLSGLRTGRASLNLLDPVVVEAYGDRMFINQLATVSAPEPRVLSIQVWDKEMVKVIEKAITNANLGVNPQTDGQIIRITMPTLTEERRKEMGKLAHKYGENSKIAIRNIRRDALDEAKKNEKDGLLSEDEAHKLSDEIQKITDGYIKIVDEKVVKKEQEITQV
jgi:ribosome recycling factor